MVCQLSGQSSSSSGHHFVFGSFLNSCHAMCQNACLVHRVPSNLGSASPDWTSPRLTLLFCLLYAQSQRPTVSVASDSCGILEVAARPHVSSSYQQPDPWKFEREENDDMMHKANESFRSTGRRSPLPTLWPLERESSSKLELPT